MNLVRIKEVIENFPKKHQIAALKIIKNNSTTTINENKSGIYINLTFLPEETIRQLQKYIEYVQDQESVLFPFESEKQNIKNAYFTPSSSQTI